MLTLLNRFRNKGRADQKSARQRYAAIVRKGDGATDAEASELCALAPSLNFTPADVADDMEAAARGDERARRDHPWIFTQPPPAPSIMPDVTGPLPAAVYALDAAEFHDPADVVAMGVDAQVVARLRRLLPTRGGKFYGASLLAWAGEHQRAYRARRRDELAAAIVPVPDRAKNLNAKAKCDRARLGEYVGHEFARWVVEKLPWQDTYTGAQVIEAVERIESANAYAREALASL